MDKVIAVIVPAESAAREAVEALEHVDEQGAIELYASTVIARSGAGEVSIKDDHDVHKGLCAFLGGAAGALIGLAGGPAGAAIGAAVGAATGAAADLIEYSGLSGGFVNDVVARVRPGGYAVIASIQEDSPEYVDKALAPLGASIWRVNADDLAAAQVRSNVRGLKEELTPRRG